MKHWTCSGFPVFRRESARQLAHVVVRATRKRADQVQQDILFLVGAAGDLAKALQETLKSLEGRLPHEAQNGVAGVLRHEFQLAAREFAHQGAQIFAIQQGQVVPYPAGRSHVSDSWSLCDGAQKLDDLALIRAPEVGAWARTATGAFANGWIGGANSAPCGGGPPNVRHAPRQSGWRVLMSSLPPRSRRRYGSGSGGLDAGPANRTNSPGASAMTGDTELNHIHSKSLPDTKDAPDAGREARRDGPVHRRLRAPRAARRQRAGCRWAVASIYCRDAPALRRRVAGINFFGS